jgi:TM2 domain-containing membrane protein YozV
VHLYAIADAAEDAWLQRGGHRPVTDMATAAFASALVPGLGQIYNTHYSKAALLYCGVIGAVVSYQSHQSMVEFWQAENARAIADSTSTTEIQEQLVFFRKRRNQYVWGLGLIYIYQILDAVVDARLSRVDQPFPISISPTFSNPGLLVSWKF